MVTKDQQIGELKMLDEWNKLVEETKREVTPEILSKLKKFVAKETIRELEEAEQNHWISSRDQVLGSISPGNTYTPQAKESWYALIEHIRKRLMADEGRIIKTFIYATLWAKYLLIGSMVAIFITIIISAI